MPDDENFAGLDLFGAPLWSPSNGRGRPKFLIDDEKRNVVKRLAGLGVSREDIAAAIECSEKTLRTYFLPELKLGPAQAKAEMLALLYSSAQRGNVSAQKKILDIMGLGVGAARAISDPVPTVPKKGKKEIQLDEAQTSMDDDDWSHLNDVGKIH